MLKIDVIGSVYDRVRYGGKLETLHSQERQFFPKKLDRALVKIQVDRIMKDDSRVPPSIKDAYASMSPDEKKAFIARLAEIPKVKNNTWYTSQSYDFILTLAKLMGKI